MRISSFPRSPRHEAGRARLSLEPLEDRRVPSTFTVLNLADGGAGSLRQAILSANAAPGADAVAFAPTVRGTITLTGGELSITDDLTISGPGAGRLTVSGNHASRVFNISDSQVAIAALTVADGWATGRQALGGGILNTGGRLSLTTVTFTGNEARGDGSDKAVAGGGAVANVYGATLVVTDCAFTENQGSAPYIGYGSILNDGGSVMTVTGSTFTGNRVSGGLRFSDGGAVANLGASTALFTHTTFEGNQVRGGDGDPGKDAGNGEGGAIVCDVSLLIPNLNSGGVLTVDHCRFLGNEARGGNGGNSGNGSQPGNGKNGDGGAIALWAGTTAAITASEFHDNRAIGGDGGNSAGKEAGGDAGFAIGGVVLNLNSRLTVRQSTFTNNQARGGSGGSSQATGGDGLGARGGVSLTITSAGLPGFHAITIFDDVLIRENQAVAGPGGDGGTGQGGNGGRARGGGLSTNQGTLIVRQSTLAGNLATGGAGGSGAIRGNGGSATGGGISFDPLSEHGQYAVSDCVLKNNRAVGGGGAVGGVGQGGAIFFTALSNVRTTATVSSTILEDNQAIGGAGTARGGNGLGGGIAVGDNTTLTLLGSSVTGNRATGGTGPTAGQGLGGGLHITPGATAYADLLTLVFANDASTSGDDVFGAVVPL